MLDSYFVYIHISPNGKKYIGITKNYLKRWRNGFGYHKNKYFYNAIQKYGWDKFKHIIIAKNLSKNIAEKMEIELIAKYKTNNKLYGYNHAIGGCVNCGYKLSDETRKKLSESHKNLPGNNKGKKLSKEQKEKVSNGMKRYHATHERTSPMKEKKHSDKTKRKMSESHKGKHSGENNAMYGKRFSDEHKKKISNSLSGRMLSDEHKKHLSDSRKGMKFSKEHIENLKNSHKNQSVKIIQKSLNGEFIRTWDSIADASRELGIDRKCISRCLAKNKKYEIGKYKTHGYIFEYYDRSENIAR